MAFLTFFQTISVKIGPCASSAAQNHMGGIASRSVPTHTTSTLTSLSPSASPDPT